MSEPVIDTLIKHLSEHGSEYRTPQAGTIIANLRTMFARISTQMLQPDLVIMDEFQRFKFLIDSEEDSETGILARQFLAILINPVAVCFYIFNAVFIICYLTKHQGMIDRTAAFVYCEMEHHIRKKQKKAKKELH